MAFTTYQQGLKQASDLANRAIQAESSLSSLSPLTSALPTLRKAFPLYISSAESYSHLLSSNLVPETERIGIKKKWRLVLERAEKVKNRIEELGGVVGKVGVGDEGEEGSIVRRGGLLNGVRTEMWGEPSTGDFVLARGQEVWRDGNPPCLAKEQIERGAVWQEIRDAEWKAELDSSERWVVRQGPGADCSVVAGLGVCLEHDRRCGTQLAGGNLYPRATSGQPQASENGKHIVKLLLNGAWRSIIIDSLLPRTPTGQPLHATAHPLTPSSSSIPSPAHIPLSLKAYFKIQGGYDIRGSDPSPDIYAYTGWIPERISLRDGSFQREKEWRRVSQAWKDGRVMITLGTGEVGDGLIPFHAYAVLSVKDEDGKRILEVFDPGISKQGVEDLSLGRLQLDNRVESGSTPSSGLCIMNWDIVCSSFDTLNLNWDPSLKPVNAIRHWSWPKPETSSRGGQLGEFVSNPRYKLEINSKDFIPGDEVWIMLSQHVTSKDRPLDDIAIHISEESQSSQSRSKMHAQSIQPSNPYTNGLHVLVKYKLRRPTTSLIIIPTRDRGLFRTDFTLQAFSPSTYTLSLDRISQTLPFSQTISSSLSSRNAGGHAGYPTWMNNPQYRIVLGGGGEEGRGRGGGIRVVLEGEKGVGWGVAVLWGKGEFIHELTEDVVIGDSGSYSRGMAYLDIPKIEPGTYTLVVSSYTPGDVGAYNLSVESSLPVNVTPIPSEGAGLYQRKVSDTWSTQTAGGRPSTGSYDRNPRIEVIIPQSCVFSCRFVLPLPSKTPIPLNLTLFQRRERGVLGDQLATSGAYSDSLCGVLLPKVKLEAGVYVLVVSAWEAGLGVGLGWEVKCWGSTSFEVEIVK